SSYASACIAHRPRASPEIVTVMVSPSSSCVSTRARTTATATVTPESIDTSGVVVQVLPDESTTLAIVGTPPGLGASHAMDTRIVAPTGTSAASVSAKDVVVELAVAVPTVPRCAMSAQISLERDVQVGVVADLGCLLGVELVGVVVEGVGERLLPGRDCRRPLLEGHRDVAALRAAAVAGSVADDVPVIGEGIGERRHADLHGPAVGKLHVFVVGVGGEACVQAGAGVGLGDTDRAGRGDVADRPGRLDVGHGCERHRPRDRLGGRVGGDKVLPAVG